MANPIKGNGTIGLKDSMETQVSLWNIPLNTKTKNTPDRAPYNFLEEEPTEKKVFEFKKLRVKTRITAKLKIWLNDPNTPNDINDNKIRVLKMDSFDID